MSAWNCSATDGVDLAGLDSGQDFLVATGLREAGQFLAGGLEGADGTEGTLVVLAEHRLSVWVALKRVADVGL